MDVRVRGTRSAANERAVIALAYLMLVGSGGWNQRWEIAAGQEKDVAEQLAHLGTESLGYLRLLDP